MLNIKNVKFKIVIIFSLIIFRNNSNCLDDSQKTKISWKYYTLHVLINI